MDLESKIIDIEKRGSLTKFSSGHDWLIPEICEDRQWLIDAAKKGCPESIEALKSQPHNLRTLTLNGTFIF